MFDKNEADYRRALEAYNDARRSLIDLAAHAIREAFIASPVGLQLALSLTRACERQRLHDAIPLIVADERLPWLREVLAEVREALDVFERCQHAKSSDMASLTISLDKAKANIAAAIPARCARDEGVVILRNVNSNLCVCGVQKRAGKTFVEYETVGATAQGNVRVITRGDTEWEVLP